MAKANIMKSNADYSKADDELSQGLEYPDTPGKWRMEEYYQKAIEDEPIKHISHWNVWKRKDGVLMASNDNQTDPVTWLGYGNQRWIRED